MSWTLVRANFARLPSDLSPFVETFRDFGVENTLEDADGLQGCVVDIEGSRPVLEGLKLALLSKGADEVVASPYVEQDWELAWRQFFKPRRVGAHFLIVPTWEVAQPCPGDIVLNLDPGQAFGTGDHPTTRLCLELLETSSLSGKRLADVGCGSGILAIAATKSGAKVVAIDIDPVALEVAKENAGRNEVFLETYCGDGLERLVRPLSSQSLENVPQDERPLQHITTPQDDSVPVGEAFDLVVSNIISATLIRISAQIAHVLKPGGLWIVSGIIEANWPEVRRSAEARGFTLVEERREDGWVAAKLKRH